jgi:hypothetical protein
MRRPKNTDKKQKLKMKEEMKRKNLKKERGAKERETR